ncbi:Retinoic acid-induced protein 1 [Larimichthys crocea]|uniref:Retinoic acid-induced protein 1 n=1 Tax=Larimichthys crocea TaxID=215358 RepID=A0A6G0HUP3_LARCR|nr:Retinoic acid-induced protein 1 [Larimichthys crocea]
MEVSSQDPALMAMDLSKGYSVNPLTRSHPEAMDLAKKPEWYHRRPPSCSTDISSPFRTRASSSYNPDPGAPVRCRDMEQRPESLGNYMNYRDGVHGNLWHHPGFYGPNQSGGPVPESSGGEESDSGSDVIFLVSSAKEPLLCSPFIQDSVRHIVEPLSPAVSSLDEGRGCYHLPQPLSSPSPDSSYSEDSSDSSVDIPVHHARPVVLLPDLSAVYGNHAESPVDVSSDDSDVIEVSVTNEKNKSGMFTRKKSPCKKSLTRETPPQSEDEKPQPREVRRSTRIRKPVSEMPQFTCSGSRHSLRRQAKTDAVGIYNESCDSEDMMEYAVRLSSSDESASQLNVPQRASSNSEESGVDVRTERKSPQRVQQPQQPRRKVSKSINHKRKKPIAVHETKKLRIEQKPTRIPPEQRQRNKSAKAKTAVRRKRKRRTQAGPSAQFPPREPEIKLKYANVEKKDKKSGSFCPFVHMEKRMCTVVNYQEEEATVRSSRGGAHQQTTTRSLTGFVPNTSSFYLGRFSPENRSQATLLCCLCGQTANAMGLGDLHGPYNPTARSADCPTRQQQNCMTEQKEEEHLRSSDDGCDGCDCSAVRKLPDSDEHSRPKVPLHLDECWIHEDCGIWSAGVFLVRGRLYGLEEAARLAQETVCSACQQTGAIMGCFQKSCPQKYHYRCAIQSGCALNEDNFSIRCPEHKVNKWSVRRPLGVAAVRHHVCRVRLHM